MSAEKLAEDAVNAAEENTKDWGEPKPIKVGLLPVDKFDADSLLPKVLKEWVLDTAGRMPCPPDFVAVAALVELGSVIGARCVVKPKRFDDWVVVPNLWGAVVALPSTKKSPAINAAMKPLDWLCSIADEEFNKAKTTYENEHVKWDARKKALEDLLKQAAKIEANQDGDNNEEAN